MSALPADGRGGFAAVSEEMADDEIYVDYDDTPLHPADLAAANAHLRHIARIKAQAADEAGLYQIEIDRLTARRDERLDALERQVAWHAAALESYHRAVLRDETDRGVGPKQRSKTLHFTCGTSTLRASAPEWSFSDEFLAWAKVNRADLVRVPEPPPPVVDRNAAKKALAGGVKIHPGEKTGVVVTDDGEVVPGVTIENREPRFSYTLEVGGDDE